MQYNTTRRNNTTTVLPNGDILITGGILDNAVSDPVYLNTAELYISSAAKFIALSSNFTNPRANHTATLLPDGNVFIFGGETDSGTAVPAADSAYLYNPNTRTLQSLSSIATLSNRFYHTATLLTTGTNTGNVLICGGLANSNYYSVYSNCLIINPHTYSTTVKSSFARFGHTATLLESGNVLLVGGRNVSNGYVTTNELFDASNNTINNAVSQLNLAREHHTSVTLPNGKVAIIGGYNANYNVYPIDTNDKWYTEDGVDTLQRQNPGTHGFRGDVELFDKDGKQATVIGTDENITSLPYRTSQHSSMLTADGLISIMGGRGNIPVSFVDAPVMFTPGSQLAFSGGVLKSTYATANVNSNTSQVFFNLDTVTLSNPVSGRIMQGDMYLPQLPEEECGIGEVGDGSVCIDFTTIAAGHRFKELRAVLDNLPVGKAISSILKSGDFNASGVQLTDLNARVQFNSVTTTENPVIRWICAFDSVELDPEESDYLTYSGTYSRYLRIGNLKVQGLPAYYKGHTLTGKATISKLVSEYKDEENSISFSFELINPIDTILFSAPVSCDEQTGCSATITSAKTDDDDLPDIQVTNTGDSTKYVQTSYFRNSSPTEFRANVVFYTDGISLEDMQYNVGVSTIVIRDMLFGNNPTYSQKDGKWDFTTDTDPDLFTRYDNPSEYGEAARYGQSYLIMSDDSEKAMGGVTCQNNNATGLPVGCTNRPSYANLCGRCNSFSLTTVGYNRDDSGIWLRGINSTIGTDDVHTTSVGPKLNTPRTAHTVTSLHDGSMLVCGGNDGLKTLDSCEYYDKAAKKWQYTIGNMNSPRANHTATLLPNGKVIIVGGTDGKTNLKTVEIYNPQTKSFRKAADINFDLENSYANHTATLLPNGNVFILGGGHAEVFLSTVSQTVEVPGVVPNSIKHAATLLKDGRVLITGGSLNGSPSSAAYFFQVLNPPYSFNTASLSSFPPFSSGIYGHTATLDKAGRVIIAGGSNGTSLSQAIVTLSVSGNTLVDPKYVYLDHGLTNHTALLTPNNKVWIVGGSHSTSLFKGYIIFSPDSGSGHISGEEKEFGNRENHVSVMDNEGNIWVIGGQTGNKILSDANYIYFTKTPDDNREASQLSSIRKPAITNPDVEYLKPGDKLTLLSQSTTTFNRFHGFTEAHGGNQTQNNSTEFNSIHTVLSAVDIPSGFLIDISTRVYSSSSNNWELMKSSITVQLPGSAGSDGHANVNPDIPWGYYYAITSTNGQFSNFKLVQVGENWNLPKISSVAPAPLDSPLTPEDAEIRSSYKINYSSITWQWPAIDKTVYPYVQNYNVEFSTFADATGVRVFTPAPSIIADDRPAGAPVTYDLTQMTPNSKASVRVQAANIWTEGEFVNSNEFYTLANPPTNLFISSVSFSAVSLEWDANGNTPGTFYQVEWCKSSNQNSNCWVATELNPCGTGANVCLSSGTARSFCDVNKSTQTRIDMPGFSPATSYFFRAKAVNGGCPLDVDHLMAGGFETGYSNVVSTITVSSIKLVEAADVTTSTITWRWDRVTDSSDIQYDIASSTYPLVMLNDESNIITNPTTPGSILYTQTHTGLNNTGSGLSPNTKYTFFVRAKMRYPAGTGPWYYGPWSEPGTAYTLANKPTGESLVAVSTISLNFMFSNSNTETTLYKIELSTSQNFDLPYDTIGEDGWVYATSTTTVYYGSTSGIPFTGLKPNTEYFARALALNDVGAETEYSSVVRTFTFASKPGDIQVVDNSMSGITIAWASNGNHATTVYKVFISTDAGFATILNTEGQPITEEIPHPIMELRAAPTVVKTTLTVSGLFTNTKYYFQVIARNGDNVYTTGVSKDVTTISGPEGSDAGSIGGTTNPSNTSHICGTLPNGRWVCLYVPAAAFPTANNMAISQVPSNSSYDFCHQMTGGLPVVAARIYSDSDSPVSPISFEIGYKTEEIATLEPIASELLLARYNSVTGDCLPLPSVFNTSTKRVEATLSTLDRTVSVSSGTFIQLIRFTPVNTLSNIKVYPNPLFPNRGGNGAVTIQPVPVNTKLTIYTLSGNKVWEGNSGNSAVILWYGENKYGNKVASGVYLGVLDSTAGKKTIKIAVER